MKKLTALLLLLTVAPHTFSQLPFDSIKVVSYNVENLFDCIDDSLTNDTEYLPGNIRGWNYTRYKTKIDHIARVICNIGGWNPPAIIGLCEVESDKCLRDMTRYSGMKNLGYRYIHYESPDARGVDVALLYQPSLYKIQASKPIKVQLAGDIKTRDILYAKGTLINKDTLHIFVCHFPSRLGGELESEDKRNEAAGTLKLHTDSILKAQPMANILVMGDFNDYPTSESIQHTLAAINPESTEKKSNTYLYNMATPLHADGKGTHKDSGEWGMLDQIIVSGNLLNGKQLECGKCKVYDADFLLEKDMNYLGKKPFRTYNGMQYQAGYSDHLPVYIDMYFYK